MRFETLTSARSWAASRRSLRHRGRPSASHFNEHTATHHPLDDNTYGHSSKESEHTLFSTPTSTPSISSFSIRNRCIAGSLPLYHRADEHTHTPVWRPIQVTACFSPPSCARMPQLCKSASTWSLRPVVLMSSDVTVVGHIIQILTSPCFRMQTQSGGGRSGDDVNSKDSAKVTRTDQVEGD